MYSMHPEKSKLYYGLGYFMILPYNKFYIREDTPEDIRKRLEKDIPEYLAEKKRREEAGDFTPFFW